MMKKKKRWKETYAFTRCTKWKTKHPVQCTKLQITGTKLQRQIILKVYEAHTNSINVPGKSHVTLKADSKKPVS